MTADLSGECGGRGDSRGAIVAFVLFFLDGFEKDRAGFFGEGEDFTGIGSGMVVC